ncbi:unnamed protein product [Durusdinium trenchii]|uniref:Uncharacterized protein n=2 Tax=Durusdinium trenchii TaxID=1381693 RepID=A0ABP0SS39_9DINO
MKKVDAVEVKPRLLVEEKPRNENLPSSTPPVSQPERPNAVELVPVAVEESSEVVSPSGLADLDAVLDAPRDETREEGRASLPSSPGRPPNQSWTSWQAWPEDEGSTAHWKRWSSWDRATTTRARDGWHRASDWSWSKETRGTLTWVQRRPGPAPPAVPTGGAVSMTAWIFPPLVLASAEVLEGRHHDEAKPKALELKCAKEKKRDFKVPHPSRSCHRVEVTTKRVEERVGRVEERREFGREDVHDSMDAHPWLFGSLRPGGPSGVRSDSVPNVVKKDRFKVRGAGAEPYERAGQGVGGGAGPLPKERAPPSSAQLEAVQLESRGAAGAPAGEERAGAGARTDAKRAGVEEDLQWAVMAVLEEMLLLKYGRSMDPTELRPRLAAGLTKLEASWELSAHFGGSQVQVQISVQELTFQELCALLRHAPGTAQAVLWRADAALAALRVDALEHVVGRRRSSGLARVAAEDFVHACALEPHVVSPEWPTTSEWQALYARAGRLRPGPERIAPELLLALAAETRPDASALAVLERAWRMGVQRVEVMGRFLGWLDGPASGPMGEQTDELRVGEDAARLLGAGGVLAIIGLAMTGLLKGCGCDGEKLMSCALSTTVSAGAVCGETEYSKVMSGATTVAACCQAIKEAQDCYLAEGCDCNTECRPQDKPLFCPLSGKLRDPTTFWAGVMDGLNKGGETCASVGVSAATC